MKLKIFITLLIVSAVTFIAYSQIKNKPFTPAEDFSREALIYVQIADLPAFIKLWNDSKVKEKYAGSTNFSWFQSGHLGLKLASRWEEFNAATGFPVDLETLAKMADNQAAIAVYDIGKLEFVFVAPVSDELFAATKFVQNKDKFTEETLDDGTTIYRAAVEADRGRQKQELIFTNVKGRFVLATSEKLLMQTLNNINGNQKKNRLIDEPTFKNLSEKIDPHTATVWLNQTALNDDYYFKHYWLMSDVKDLKNIRAGIFDFAMHEGKLIEKRRFLLNETVNAAPLGKAQTEQMLAFAPADISFYRIRKISRETVDETVERTIGDFKNAENDVSKQTSFSVPEGYTSSGYDLLGEKFDNSIDEISDDETIAQTTTDIDVSAVFQSASPQAVLTFTSPKVLPAPHFIEFRRAAVFNLAAPANFNQTAFEAAIERKLAAQVLISSPDMKLNWETKSENNVSRRELNLPMLGQSVSYAVRENELILTNDGDFLGEILAAAKPETDEISAESFSELTVINLNQRENAYDEIFNKMAEKTETSSFFTDNISSLLDSISEVKRIEITKSYAPNIFEEQLVFFLQ